MPRSGQNTNPEIKNNNGRRRRSRKRGKSNNKQGELVAAVSGDDKSKEPYCFKCGEPDHTVTKCTKKESELKCKAHPDSNSHADLTCFHYRRGNSLHILTRPRPGGSRDSSRGAKSPVAANFAHVEDDESVDHTE